MVKLKDCMQMQSISITLKYREELNVYLMKILILPKVYIMIINS
jgi:hypothetical protein